MYNHFYCISFFQKLRGIDQFFRDVYLFESLGMHHHIVFAFFVQELIRTSFDTGRVDFNSRGECVFKYTAGFYVSQLGSHECRTFTGFYMLKLYDCI